MKHHRPAPLPAPPPMEKPLMRSRPSIVALLLLLVLAVGAGCAKQGTARQPERAGPPDLRGATVMLVPALTGSPAQVDAELAFWLQDRAPDTEWILPAKLEAVAARTPQWRLTLRNDPRTVVEVSRGQRRLADPLYGDLRKLAAVLDAGYALVPMTVRAGAGPDGAAATITAAFVNVRGGEIVWMGTVGGEAPAGGDEAAAVAAAASALARALSP